MFVSNTNWTFGFKADFCLIFWLHFFHFCFGKE